MLTTHTPEQVTTSQRQYVKDVSLAGFRAAITRSVLHAFSWEHTTMPALLFLGTGQLLNAQLSQDTWFEVDDANHQVKYIVRLVNINETSEMYTDERGAFSAVLTMDEAADLLDMCIAQVHAENALSSGRAALNSMRRDD